MASTVVLSRSILRSFLNTTCIWQAMLASTFLELPLEDMKLSAREVHLCYSPAH